MDDAATSTQDGSSPKPHPKSLMDLPAELRERIFHLCFSEETMVVFARSPPTIPNGVGPKHPATTMPVTSKYRIIYTGANAAFGSSSNSGPSTRAATDGATSRIGILYASRRVHREAVQHLYKSCTFFFEDPDLSKKFLETAGPRNIKDVSKIAVYYTGETFVSLLKWGLMCHRIVRAIPQVEELTVWTAETIELEINHQRNHVYEAALLEFAALQQIGTLDVKKFVDPFDNSGDEDVQWHTEMCMNEYTIRGVKEMIRTVDRLALDRARTAFLGDQ